MILKSRKQNKLRLSALGATIFFVLMAASFSAFGAEASGAVASKAKIFQWSPFLGPFHTVVLHFPIGFLTAAFFLELFRLKRPSDDLRQATLLMLWLSLGSGILAATFGLMRASKNSYDPAAVSNHRTLGFLVLGFTLLTIILQTVASRRKPVSWLWTYRLSLLATLGFVSAAGHFGGNLTHGSNYLVEHAPEFLRNMLAQQPKIAALASNGAADSREQFFKEKVEPILANKCYTCHGPEKKKGDFRLDVPEHALRGGASEKAAIKPGDPLGSNLVRLILLPPDDDDVMPPSGKTRLTPEEIGYVIQWIRDGAIRPGTAQPPTVAQEG